MSAFFYQYSIEFYQYIRFFRNDKRMRMRGKRIGPFFISATDGGGTNQQQVFR